MTRRRWMLGLGLAALVAACRHEERCKTCGMRIAPGSAWRATLVEPGGRESAFDTPRCALLAWRRGKVNAERLRVRDYYDQKEQDAEPLRFVEGSDVVGPMGPELVPVDAARTPKFMQDHAGKRALSLGDITDAVLSSK